ARSRRAGPFKLRYKNGGHTPDAFSPSFHHCLLSPFSFTFLTLCRAAEATSRPPCCELFDQHHKHNMAAAATSVHDFTVKVRLCAPAPQFNSLTSKMHKGFSSQDASGKDVSLSAYKGKVLLIVNVASQCGLTNSNYTELGQLYDMYKDQGFEILAFPCNQFGGQEPGTNEEIVEFVCTRFKANYPIFDKVDVNGEDAAPIYKFLKSSKTGPFGDNIKWNFAKFLVDKQGRVAERYGPTTYPFGIQKDIKKLLGNLCLP
ncbi:hypothetical protein EJB05_06722, partial [Eragrostis curvula]